MVEHFSRGHETVTKTPKICPYFHEWIETEQWDDYEDKACIQTNVTAVACSFDDKSLWPRTQKHDWRLNKVGHCETVRLILWDEVKPNDRIAKLRNTTTMINAPY